MLQMKLAIWECVSAVMVAWSFSVGDYHFHGVDAEACTAAGLAADVSGHCYSPSHVSLARILFETALSANEKQGASLRGSRTCFCGKGQSG